MVRVVHLPTGEIQESFQTTQSPQPKLRPSVASLVTLDVEEGLDH